MSQGEPVPFEGHLHLQRCHRCCLQRSICWSQRPACAVLVNVFPGLQTGHEASAFPAGSEGATSRDTLPLPFLLPLQGVKSDQRLNNVNRQSVVQLVIASQWLMLAVAQRSSQCVSDKLNYYGHGVEDQLPWPGRSLNMFEPTPIHGQILLLVSRYRKVMKQTT